MQSEIVYEVTFSAFRNVEEVREVSRHRSMKAAQRKLDEIRKYAPASFIRHRFDEQVAPCGDERQYFTGENNAIRNL